MLTPNHALQGSYSVKGFLVYDGVMLGSFTHIFLMFSKSQTAISIDEYDTLARWLWRLKISIFIDQMLDCKGLAVCV